MACLPSVRRSGASTRDAHVVPTVRRGTSTPRMRARGALARVLVLDTHQRIGLAACRALGAAGFEVGAADSSEDNLGGRSRYTTRPHRIPSPLLEGAAFSATVEDLIARFGYEVVVGTDDGTLTRLEVAPPSVPTVPDLGSGFAAVRDKATLGDLAARAGVRYPRTAVAAAGEQDEAAVETVGLPCFVKASQSGLVDGDRVHLLKGAVRADTRAAALAAIAQFRSVGCLPIVQEAVERLEKYVAVVIRANGRSEVRFARHVLREWPPRGGISTVASAASSVTGDGARSCDALERILDAAAYEGVAGAEFIRTETYTDELVLVDVNPRLFGSLTFGERLGLRITERAVRQALGLPRLPDGSYEVGRRYHHLAAELRWLRAPRAERGSLRALRGTYGLRDIYENVEPRDLRPLVSLLLKRVGVPRPLDRWFRARRQG